MESLVRSYPAVFVVEEGLVRTAGRVYLVHLAVEALQLQTLLQVQVVFFGPSIRMYFYWESLVRSYPTVFVVEESLVRAAGRIYLVRLAVEALELQTLL